MAQTTAGTGFDEDAAQELAALWSHRLLNTLGVAAYAADQLDRRGPGLSAEQRIRARHDIDQAIAESAALARLLLRHPTLLPLDVLQNDIDE